MKDKILTTSAGSPIADDNNSISAGPDGPLTFDNFQLFEKLAHFNRERIPERVVHARGTGAYGTFTLSKTLTEYTRANFLQVEGQQTDVFVRFSTVGGGQDSSDYARDPRGFAVKFYTDEGNFDLVGNNTPVFFLNDPLKFPDFVHSQKKNPKTNLPDAARMYEFWANHPQSLHQITILMSDRGIPFSWRHMNGYGSHTYGVWNSKGERFWVKWHFKSEQGIRCLSEQEAGTLPPFGAQQDLLEAIERKDFPGWSVKLQILSEDQAKVFPINPFDLTKVWPHQLAPLQDIGRLTLNRNVENYFAETEQATFAPSNLVPGICASPDKMLQARLLAYQDAQRYRVGVNHNHLPVNAPRCPMHHYQRDGAMAGMNAPTATGYSHGNEVNFFPNDQSGSPRPAASYAPPPLPLLEDAWVKPYHQDDEDYYQQAGDLYRIFSDTSKTKLAETIAAGLTQATPSVQERMLGYFNKADADYADRIRTALAAIK